MGSDVSPDQPRGKQDQSRIKDRRGKEECHEPEPALRNGNHVVGQHLVALMQLSRRRRRTADVENEKIEEPVHQEQC